MSSHLAARVLWLSAGRARAAGLFVSRMTAVAGGAGCVAMFAFASGADAGAGYARAVAGLRLGAGCAAAAGALVGFLFGIPRTLSSPADETSAGWARAAEGLQYRVNTNLEQISDWLTKILVGVGLAELHRMPAALRATADYFAAAIDGRAGADLSGFVAALLAYFAVVGLMAGYLGTRVLLAPLFRLADARERPGTGAAR
jgi:hypothetical protein